jgi:hypothetical protein
MVDNKRRKILAHHLRQLSIGLINGDDFEELVMTDIANGYLPDDYYLSSKSKNDDGAIRPILEYSWCLYDELDNRLTGKNKLDEYQLKEIARLILFLHSGQEYEWDYVDITNPVLRFSFKDIMKSIMTLGKHYKEKILTIEQAFEEMKKKGDFEYWPFRTKEQFEIQLTNQPFLAGA